MLATSPGILGLSQAGNVSLYQRRYPDMPRPVISLGRGRCMLWLRPDIEKWAHDLSSSETDAETALVDLIRPMLRAPGPLRLGGAAGI